jgi:hypothetical protein
VTLPSYDLSKNNVLREMKSMALEFIGFKKERPSPQKQLSHKMAPN